MADAKKLRRWTAHFALLPCRVQGVYGGRKWRWLTTVERVYSTTRRRWVYQDRSPWRSS